MKKKARLAREARQKRIEEGTNNGWLNFLILKECPHCETQDSGAYCAVRNTALTEEDGCIKESYLAQRVHGKPLEI